MSKIVHHLNEVSGGNSSNMIIKQVEISLKEWLTKNSYASLKELLQIAIAITETVNDLHRQQEVLGTLSPANFIIGADINIIRLAEVGENKEAYRAPEQTGRINVAPDHRSDLYTLGVIFYEMLTGELPFYRQDKEDWGYVHLAVVPRPITTRREDVSSELSAIVMKLLRKTPNERYQSAYGLIYDLKQYINHSANRASVIAEPELIDDIRRFTHPLEWYGAGLDTLKSTIETTVAGKHSTILVMGEAGTGKTKLISEWKRILQEKEISMLEVSCDNQQNDKKFYVIKQAMAGWLQQLWLEEPNVITMAKKRIQQLLGDELSVFAGWLPEMQIMMNYPMDAYSDQEISYSKLNQYLPAIWR